jgi:hypothetical protein
MNDSERRTLRPWGLERKIVKELDMLDMSLD